MGLDVGVTLTEMVVVVCTVGRLESDMVKECGCSTVKGGTSIVVVGIREIVGTREVVIIGLGSTAAHRTLELLRALFSGQINGK